MGRYAAKSGRSPVKKVVSSTTGSQVLQTQPGDRSQRPILRRGRSPRSAASRHQEPNVHLPVTDSNWPCRRRADTGSTKWLRLPEGGHGKPDILGKLSIVADGLLAGGPIELAALRGGALGLIEVVQAVNQYRNHFGHPGFTLIRDVH